MIVDNVWKLTNTVRFGLDSRSSHAQRQSTFPDNVCSYWPPCHGVSHCENFLGLLLNRCENWTTFLFFFKKNLSLVKKWWRGMTKRIRERVAKAKRAGLSWMMWVGNLWVTRLRLRVWSQLRYAPVWTYLRCPRGTIRNTSLIRWRTNDGLKTIILSSSSGDVAFLTPHRVTWLSWPQLRIIFDEDPGQNSEVMCARENDGCWGQPFQDGSWRLGHYWTVYIFINDCRSCCEAGGGW